MKRRWFLTTMVAGTGLLSGCTTSSPPTNQETLTSKTTTRTTTTETTSNEDIQRRVSLADVDEVPDEHDLRIEVELLQSTVTDAHTAHLRLTATDETSRKRRIGIGTGKCSLFNRTKGKSDPPGLWLLTPDNTSSKPADSRWKVTRDQFLMYGCAHPVSEHNKPITNEYRVWDDAEVDGYMTPGTYRFATSIAVGGQGFGSDPTIIGDNATTTEDATTATTEPASDFTWGFSLVVENPND